MEESVNESRRSFIATSGKAIAGAAVASSVLSGTVKDASAYRYKGGYKYTKLDPAKVGEINSVTHTPLIATTFITVAILIFALLLPLLSLAKLTSYITLIIFALINFALLKIKYSGREYDGFTVPVWVPAIGGVSTSLFILYLATTFV